MKMLKGIASGCLVAVAFVGVAVFFLGIAWAASFGG